MIPRRGFGMVSRKRVDAALCLIHDGRVLLIVGSSLVGVALGLEGEIREEGICRMFLLSLR